MRRLRPMGIADILDESVDLYKSNFILLVGIAAILYVPYFLLQRLVQATIPPGVTQQQQIAAALGIFAISLVAALFVTPIVTGALTFAISDRYLSREASIRGCYSRVFRGGVFWRLFAAILLKDLIWIGALVVIMIPAILVGFAGPRVGPIVAILVLVVVVLAAIIGAIVLALKLWMVEPALILETRGAGDAIGRSWALMRGNLRKALSLFVVVGFVVAVIALIVTGPTQMIITAGEKSGQPVSHWIVALDVVLGMLANVLLTPFMSIVAILLYYDIRMRREGFDLQVMAEELDAKARDFTAREVPAMPQEQLRSPEEPQ